MLTDLELMKFHVRALFTHDPKSRLLCVNEPDGPGTPAARLYLGRTRLGNVWRFRADVPEDLINELDSLCANEPPMSSAFNEPPRHNKTYVRLLEKHASVKRVSAGPAYHFPENITPTTHPIILTTNDAEKLKDGFEELIAELPAWQPFVAIVESHRAVSVCRSVRITSEAHEAGVKTLPEFRGKGYAKDVAAEWARRVRGAGAIPLYSTSWDNKSSQAVARKLGLECYGTDVQIF